MAISRVKVWIAEVLTYNDLNAEFNNLIQNPVDLWSPAAKAASMGGFALNFDAANTMSLTSSTKGLNLSSTTAINDVFTTVASATTPDIWTAVGGVVNYTGTATATGFAAAPQAGSRRVLICAGAAVFTAGANVLIQGYGSGSTYTATAGDIIFVYAITTTQFRLLIFQAADGRGSFTATLTGCTTSPTVTASYSVTNGVATVFYPGVTATSNTTDCTLTGQPAAIRPASSHGGFFANVQDNSGSTTTGLTTINISTGVVALSASAAGAAFTAAGGKGIPNGFTVTYNLT